MKTEASLPSVVTLKTHLIKKQKSEMKLIMENEQKVSVKEEIIEKIHQIVGFRDITEKVEKEEDLCKFKSHFNKQICTDIKDIDSEILVEKVATFEYKKYEIDLEYIRKYNYIAKDYTAIRISKWTKKIYDNDIIIIESCKATDNINTLLVSLCNLFKINYLSPLVIRDFRSMAETYDTHGVCKKAEQIGKQKASDESDREWEEEFKTVYKDYLFFDSKKYSKEQLEKMNCKHAELVSKSILVEIRAKNQAEAIELAERSLNAPIQFNANATNIKI